MRMLIYVMCIFSFLWMLPRNNTANAERILVITSAPLYSHQIIFQTLCLALNKRGHELVVVTPQILKKPTLENYTEIGLPIIKSIMENVDPKVWKMPLIEMSKHIEKMKTEASIRIFDASKFKKFYSRDSNEKFDAVIIEAVSPPSLFAIAYRFNAPLIGVMSVNIHNYHRYVFGSPILPSHPSNWELDTPVGENPCFWERLQNFIEAWNYIYYWTNYCTTVEQEIVKKYLGNDVPHVIDIMKNMSVMLVNDNPIFMYPRPEQTNVVFFNGIHIKKTSPPLPKDLRQFLDNATEGFIYLNLGSTIKFNYLPRGTDEIFIKVFSKLPYKIVWKFDCDELPRKLDNVFISKWFPQQSVLAHPNIKLFIYQGGLQSTEEAVHYAIPLLGIPIIFEQKSRVQRLSSLGAAIYLDLNKLTESDLETAIHQILDDKSYKEKMTYLSSLSKDQAYDSMENAIWWIEFVMRHKGIHYLRFTESDKPWYQRYDMDIIALLSTMLFILACVIMLIIYQILRFNFKQCYALIHKSSSQHEKKH